MSEKEKNIEKERKAVLALLLRKAGLKYKDLQRSGKCPSWNVDGG